MKKGIIFGFFVGLLIPIFIFSIYFVGSYAPQKHESALNNYEKNVYLYSTFLECKECRAKGESGYACALNVAEKNIGGKFRDFEEMKKSNEELVQNRIQSLTKKCNDNSIEDLKTDPYLYCGESGDITYIGSGTNVCCSEYTLLKSGYGNQAIDFEEMSKCCEDYINECCNNIEKSIRIFAESEFVEGICNEPAVTSTATYYSQDKKYLDESKLPPEPTLKEEYSKLYNFETIPTVMWTFSTQFASYSFRIFGYNLVVYNILSVIILVIV